MYTLEKQKKLEASLCTETFMNYQIQGRGGTGDPFYHNVDHLCTFSLIGYMLNAHRTQLNKLHLVMPGGGIPCG